MIFDFRLALMTGTDIPIPECQLTVKQPTIKEISMIGERDFLIGAQLLCITKEDFGNEVLDINSNFELLMLILEQDEAKEKKIILKVFLELLLPKYQIIITPRSILCKKDEESLIIDEGNFEFLQMIVRKICGIDKKPKQEGEIHDVYNPANERAKQIAEKIYKGREELARRRAEANPDDSMFSRYISILAVGLHMSIEDLKNLTVFQISDLFERFTLWTQSDIDIRIRLAGGGPSDNQTENWMKPLH